MPVKGALFGATFRATRNARNAAKNSSPKAKAKQTVDNKGDETTPAASTQNTAVPK